MLVGKTLHVCYCICVTGSNIGRFKQPEGFQPGVDLV